MLTFWGEISQRIETFDNSFSLQVEHLGYSKKKLSWNLKSLWNFLIYRKKVLDHKFVAVWILNILIQTEEKKARKWFHSQISKYRFSSVESNIERTPKTLTNSACSRLTLARVIFRASELFVSVTEVRTTCSTIWRKRSDGLGSRERSTWPSLPGNSVNAFWDWCSRKWMGLKKKEGIVSMTP